MISLSDKRDKWKKVLINSRPDLEEEIEYIFDTIKMQDKEAIKELKEIDFQMDYDESGDEFEERILNKINKIFGKELSSGVEE